MLKKTLQISLALFLIGNSSFAQWNGNPGTTNLDIYREGNVGIGTTTTPAAKLDVNFFSGSGSIPQYGLLLNTTSFGTAANADNSYYLKTLDKGNGVVNFIIKGNGLVGIGTQSPSAWLHVYNPYAPVNTVGSQAEFARFSGTTSDNSSQFRFLLKRHTLSSGGWLNMSGRLQFTTDVVDQGYVEFNPKDGYSGMAFGSENGEIMRLLTNGDVGIGTTDTKGYKLAVNGSAIFTRVKVATYGNWADYVFTANYRLRSLSEVEQYIKQHNHLPDVPSAEEVEKNGLDIADNQATLLKKIEELTLYVIEQNKRIQMLESKQSDKK
jgi:hypothetical protein